MANRGKVYNRIYTPELWEEVNKENKIIMNDYLEEYKQRKKSKGTIDQYFNDLRIVFIFILNELNNQSILNLKKKDFRRFNIWCQERDMSNARVNRLMSSIRSMLAYVEDDEEYDYEVNYASKVKGLAKEPVRIDEDDFFCEFDSPKYQITEKIKENLKYLLFLLREVKKEAEKNGIVSRIDEVIEEFLQLEKIFFFKAKEKIFEEEEGKIYKTKSSCLKIFRLCLEKEYNNFLKVDVLFLKQLLSKAITVVDYVLGTETLAFDEALSELSRLVKK